MQHIAVDTYIEHMSLLLAIGLLSRDRMSQKQVVVPSPAGSRLRLGWSKTGHRRDGPRAGQRLIDPTFPT
jgi:hypothetical protein